MGNLKPAGAALTAIILAAALTGCGGGSADSDSQLECLPVGADVAPTLASGANDIEITPTGAVGAVKAPDRKDAYLVAMEFTVPGVDEAQIGVWMTSKIEGNPAPILAVDGMAHEFTVWPNAIDGEELSVTEPGVEDAKACLEQ